MFLYDLVFTEETKWKLTSTYSEKTSNSTYPLFFPLVHIKSLFELMNDLSIESTKSPKISTKLGDEIEKQSPKIYF